MTHHRLPSLVASRSRSSAAEEAGLRDRSISSRVAEVFVHTFALFLLLLGPPNKRAAHPPHPFTIHSQNMLQPPAQHCPPEGPSPAAAATTTAARRPTHRRRRSSAATASILLLGLPLLLLLLAAAAPGAAAFHLPIGPGRRAGLARPTSSLVVPSQQQRCVMGFGFGSIIDPSHARAWRFDVGVPCLCGCVQARPCVDAGLG